jgi:hypothetical protein
MNTTNKPKQIKEMEHCLKIKPQYLTRITSGQKLFELRYNDRDYQVGDSLWLDDGNRPAFKVEITYVLSYPEALKENWVVLGITELLNNES